MCTFCNYQDVFEEVQDELNRQDEKWGEQNHPNGTGPDHVMWPAVAVKVKSYGAIADAAKQATDTAAKLGGLTYADILLEEVFEAMAEADAARLRAELIQSAAVCVAWIQKIDRDKAGKA